MILNQPIDLLPATSIITIRRLKSLGIQTFWDLLNYFPFRYENYSLISTIDKLQEGEIVTVKGQVTQAKFGVSKKGTKIQKFVLADKTGKVELIWYNQPYLLRLIKPGSYLSVAGVVKQFSYKSHVEPQEYELLKIPNQPTIHTGRLVPIYSEKNGLSSKTIREKIFYLISNVINQTDQKMIFEILPLEIISYNNLVNELSAYQNIHFPNDTLMAEKAKQRLAFDEFFTIQLSVSLLKLEWEKESVTNPYKIDENLIKNFIAGLPFQLTDDQNNVLREIINDLKKPRPMNRFLQGDVGSGKTVVATIACYISFLNGFQSVFMAPTEILAHQHFKTIQTLFQRLNVNHPKSSKLNISLITRSIKPKSNYLENTDIIIGTHALIQKNLKFERVGLVVIDEQHRFGVAQRALLKEKGVNPHLLTMTATPIPRTVALTLYGELDMSIINMMPKGRLPVKTYLVPKEKRESAYQWIRDKIKKNQAQVFIVCPLIEESEIETMKSVKAAKKEYEFLKDNVFSEFKVGLIHGKMKSKDKNQIMTDFKDRRYDILVATSLVEVGIDIPNASIMLIEAAERYGLAQLHQLRGRVGRGTEQSYCFLFTENQDENIISRLNFFSKTGNGIELSEYDLKSRGPGEIYGIKQHGFINLKIASLADYNLISQTKKAVNYFINRYKLSEFPEIKHRVEEYRVKQIARD